MDKRFNGLIQYNNIFVTGCQRSGTRFFTKAISNDTGKIYVDEKEFGVHNVELFKEFIEEKNGLVVHCPAMSIHLEFLVDRRVIKNNDLVVWCYRSKKDVFSSMKRLGWNDFWEQANYFKWIEKNEDIQDVKNRYWEETQHSYLKDNGIDFRGFRYEMFDGHPIWKSEEERRRE